MNLLKLCGDKELRFFTFTLKHNDSPLKAQLDRLTRSWRKLRSWDGWKRSQRGGVAVLEIKRSKCGCFWHPHLHVISEGLWLENRELSVQWKKITGDSFIVDVRRVRDAKEALRYISKYASKGIDFSARCDTTALAEAIGSLGSKRLVQCYGTWSKLKTTDPPSTESWSRWITLEELLRRAASGGLESRRILRSLQDTPAFLKWFDDHPNRHPPPIDPSIL